MNKRQAKKYYKKLEAIPYLRYRYKKTIMAADKIYRTYLDLKRPFPQDATMPVIEHSFYSFMSYMRAAISLKNKHGYAILSDYFVRRNRYGIMMLERTYYSVLNL